jgi:hypothetical protein
MDWNAAIERHRDTLKRILAALVAMAGLADGRTTLPRHLHRAVMRLLRPAEAAAQRLIIAQARGLAVALRARKEGAMALPRRAKLKPERFRPLGFPLLDPIRQPFLRRRPVLAGVPRISVPGFSAPFPVAPPLLPHDPANATRLGRRLAALALVLDDLPGQARRFARWQARGADADRAEISGFAGAKTRQAPRVRRLWPLRPGSPPGGRRRPVHEVNDVLKAAHGLAFWALQRSDTS